MQDQQSDQKWWLGEDSHVAQFLIIADGSQSYSEVRSTLEQVIQNQGIILGHISSEVFIILSSFQKVQQLQNQLQSILVAVEYKPSYKVSPELAQLLQSDINSAEIERLYEGVAEGYAILQLYLIEAIDTHNLDYSAMEDKVRNQVFSDCKEECELKRYGVHHMWIQAPVDKLGNVVHGLVSFQFVLWIDVQDRVKVYNYFANSIVQVGKVGLAEAERPFWDAGVTGLGQMVGVGDTGLDYDSCFFRDDNITVPSLSHRKVVAYRNMGDEIDGSGHGTHVCGTILGQVELGRKDHNGIAPDARIAFTDLGQGEDKFLKLPQEGMEQYYGWSYALGVRTHSDSWGGGPSGGYKYTSRDADKFMWDNMDFIAVLAAGNEGETFSRETTINSLAACKNAIAVGATLGPFGGVNADVQGRAISFEVVSPEDSNDIIKVVQAEFGPGFEGLSSSQTYVVETTIPEDACGEGVALQGEAPELSVDGKIALVSRGNCKYLDKVLAAQQAGAVAIFVYNTLENEYGYSSMAIPKTFAEEESKIEIPSANIAHHVAEQLFRIKQRGELRLQLSPVQINSDQVPRFDNIASFSSFGPTEDNRIKPDIVALGEAIRSAYGDRDLHNKNCQTAQLTGTSMSTPVIAGAILLIRQYYQDGFYPNGIKSQANAFNPSSALVKATLLNGAVDLQGVAETGLPLEPSPSIKQGWGRVNLATTLALPDSQFTLWVEQNNSLATNVNHQYCVKIPMEVETEYMHPLSVTLVWTDYPAELQSVNGTLVNDLDLKVISPPGLPRSTRGPAPDPDRRNNVEREIVRLPVQGASYMVLVSGFDVKQVKEETGGQPYALAVTAPKGTVVEQCEECFECPSRRPVDSNARTSVGDVPLAQTSTPLSVEDPFDDPCACSNTGYDLGTGAFSGFIGCAQHSLASGDQMRSCYVVDSVGCGDGAFPSVVIEGVAWRQCNLFEEMYSSVAIWEDPKPGTPPQFIQNETTLSTLEDEQMSLEEPLLVSNLDSGESPAQQTVAPDQQAGTMVIPGQAASTATPDPASTPTPDPALQTYSQGVVAPQLTVVLPPGPTQP
eukprot:TRINITY_DN725_c0_g1_i3.p1 TRINITY_DN725_c0_g1~~TRINITY_DN725_c0_g1_i3.p1  ORF type:complete len:1105 (+),score=142.03 TRINITY_DN725_c0_g1_i3:113-3316(+)